MSWRGYRDAVARWHTPTPGKVAPVDDSKRPMLALVSLNTGESGEFPAATDQGGFSAASLERAARLLRDSRTGQSHPIEPATLDLVYQAQRRFLAHEIRVVSAYRAPGPARPAPPPRGRGKKPAAPPRERLPGIHGQGRAIDLVVPGASDKDVAEWARAQGFVGVGIYPNAGYCHLDVRPQSYFWVDSSGPGQRNREAPTQRDVARRSDEEARRRGKAPVRPYVLPARALEPAEAPAPPVQEPEEAHDHSD